MDNKNDIGKYTAKKNNNGEIITIEEHSNELIEKAKKLKEYGYIKEGNYKLLEMACKYHDYGKANREFQKAIEDKTDKREGFGEEGGEVPHNILSVFFVPEDDIDENEYKLVTQSILNHHHYVDNYEYLYEHMDTIENALKNLGIDEMSVSKFLEDNDDEDSKDGIILKGLLNKCDYSASGHYEIEHNSDFLEGKLEGLGYEWNELQKFCKENREENIIAIAQTGMGKTEGGLLWIGDNKGFFVLPLKTAINAIYERVKQNIIKEEVESRVGLLHGDMRFKYNEYSKGQLETDNEKILEYAAETKNFSMPLTITTLDQIFNFTFKYTGYEFKLATMSYSKIVIDEIQMYGADLLAFLIYGLKMINKVGGKFAIVTATLPPFVLDLIKDKIPEANVKEGKFINDQKRHNIKIEDNFINMEYVKKIYEGDKEKKILVVCNTVKVAQKMYKDLKESIGEEADINILHSKFIKKDRTEKEVNILEFGKTENVGKGIWITTQVVEASLDIDFDVLITELSDINSFFQRLGRCNRKGEKSVEKYNAYLFLNISDKLLTKDGKGFIDRSMHNISKEALRDINGVVTEEEKIDIIEKNLTTEKLKNSDYVEEFNGSYDYIESQEVGTMELKKVHKYFRNITNVNIIPEEVYKDNKIEIEECVDFIKNREEKDVLEKINKKEKVKSYTVPIQYYEFRDAEKVRTIELGYEEIHVIKCDYKEVGFELIKKKKK